MKKCVRASLSGLLFFLCLNVVQNVSAQSITVTGKVTDDANAGLGGVTVQVKGSSNSTQTATDGTYSLSVPNLNVTLVFTYVGYLTRETGLAGGTILNIDLRPDPQSLENVVVVGYGTQKKSDVTGSLVKISAETIRERPAQNVLQAVQGKAAGVQVSSNFKPGELPIVRVRGNRSINASNDPLYVIDGIPLVNSLGVSSFSINDLNPNDIASIEVLKDASATAIYGSRGANGVVLITTIKAKRGRATLEYNSTVSIDSYKSLTDWMDGPQYIDRWRLAQINGRQYANIPNNADLTKPAIPWYPSPGRDSLMIGLNDPVALGNVMNAYLWNPDGTVQTRATTDQEKAWGWGNQVPVYDASRIATFDWLGAAARTGISQNHQISLTAGTELSRVAISLGYYNQLGVQRDQDYKRYTANISGDISPVKWFTLGLSLLAAHSGQNYGIQPPNTSNTGPKDLYSRAGDQFPFAFARDANGVFLRNAGPNINLWNPLIDLTQAKNDRRSTSIMANLYAEIKFTPWLRYRVNFGPQYRQFRNGQWRGPEATPHFTAPSNTAGYAVDENFSWVVENLIFVDKTIAKDHRIGVTLLQSSQKSRRENSGINVNGVINPLSLWYDLAANTQGNPGIGTGFTENQLTSFMGRINYTLFDKYLLTASLRADGASVLAEGHKWDYFPSLALAWKLQDEAFIKGISWITELKPRFGWGVTGNSAVNPYTTTGPLSRNNYAWGSNPAIGYLPQLVQSPLLKWEETMQTNWGLDFMLFNNRLSGSIEYYTQTTTDLIFRKALPAVSGYVEKFENVGKTRNKGIEITLSGIPIQQKDFTWSLDVNWSKNNEEILELMNGKQDMVANGLFIGQPIQIFRQIEAIGIWGNSTKELEEMAKYRTNGHLFFPGTIRVRDVDTNYRIDGNDLLIRGTPRPKWSGGITTTFTYKNWQLSSFIYFRWGQTYFGGFPNSYGGLFPNGRVENDVWDWNNPNGKWPMPNSGNVSNLSHAMQYNDGSFGVVRNISLSYSFNQGLIKKVALRNLTLNFQVLNPFIFGGEIVKWGINPDDDTNWSNASSNLGPLGGTNNNTIMPQSFVFGLRAGF